MGTMLRRASHRIVCASFFILAVTSFVSGQARDRIVEVYEEADAPLTVALQVVEIKAGSNTVTLGQPFAADDDWLRSLSVRIKNVSGKTINVLPISFGLSELNTGKGGDISFTIMRGLYGNGDEIREASDERKPILPDEEIDFTFTEKQLCIIRQMAEQKEITPTRIKFRPSAFVTFADGSRVRSGFSYPK